MRQYMKCLKYEAKLFAAQLCRGIIVQRRNGNAVNANFAGIQHIQTSNQIQQGRFAHTGIPHDGDILACSQRIG